MMSEWWSVGVGSFVVRRRDLGVFVHRSIRGVERGPGGRARRHGPGVGARYTARDLGDDPGRGGCDWNPRGFRSTPRGAAQLGPPHAPGATPRCPAKGHAVDLERVGKGRRAPMSTPSGILNRISASLIVSSRSITLVY